MPSSAEAISYENDADALNGFCLLWVIAVDPVADGSDDVAAASVDQRRGQSVFLGWD